VKATCFVAATVMMCGAGAAAQEARPQQSTAQAPSATSRPAPAFDPRRDDIRTMEMLLTTALQKGAQDLARLLRVSEPNSAFVTGTGRTRGFVLEGYGLFFDVDVPNMKYSAVWSAQILQLVQDRAQWAEALGSGRLDAETRKVAEAQIRQNTKLIAAAQGGAVLIPNATANTTQVAPPDRVSAAVDVSESRLAQVPVLPAAQSSQQFVLPPVVPEPEVRDPNELYTESVKNALIDAMLRHSAFLKIGDNDWLTVAASDSTGPQVGQLDDTSRIVIRVKGSDLAAFHAQKLTRDEVMKRVEVREF
jgi:hypothetical protein